MTEPWQAFGDLVLAPGQADDKALAKARDELKGSLQGDSAFATVAANAALTPGETEALAVLAAAELAGLPTSSTVDLGRIATRLGADRHPGAPEGGLRRAALVSIGDDDGGWAGAPVRPAPLLMWWLLGECPRDPGLPDGSEDVELAARGDADLVLVAGPDRVRRLQATLAALAAPRLLLTPPPETPAGWDAVVRYATVSGRGVVLELGGELTPYGRGRVDAAAHLPWAVTSAADLPVDSLPRRPWRHQPVAPPHATAAEVEAVFGPEADRLPMLPTATQVQQVAELAPRFGDPLRAVRWLAHGRLDRLATRIEPAATWDDLVLPPDRLTLVREVMIRQRQRRRVLTDWGLARAAPTATIAMFAGQSGTGKTLAAEVVAGALELDLYQIDVSQLVSKYIGETEKNLGQVFDAAGSVPCVLFFDEADALFGKRSEVSDAHDRYANIEVAYLLQRLEQHNGIVILASNLAANLDKAFARRIHVAVDFPMPGAVERQRIWDRCLPAPEHRGELDLERLAAYELSGGNIRNAALRAAFLAADEDSPVTMPVLTEALRREMIKLGRHVPA